MTDFSTPRRMSPGAFLIMFLKSSREIIGITFVAIVYLFYDSSDSGGSPFRKVALAASIILVYSLAVAFARYYFRKFHIEGDKLIYTHGVAKRETVSIPLSSVHNLRTKSGLVYRLLGMRGVAFDTLASDDREVELILDEADWQKLLESVDRGETAGLMSNGAEAITAPPPPVGDETKRVSNLNILKGALCQNHLKGFAVLATIAFALMDKIGQLDEDATTRVIDYIDTHAGGLMPTVWQFIGILLAIYLIVMALWTGKIALRYGDMSLALAHNRLTIESGLISKFTCRLTRDKTTVLTIKQNPLEKIADCQTISLHQAVNATDKDKESDIRIYGTDLGSEMLAWWLGDNREKSDTPLLAAASGIGLMWRRFIPQLLIAAGAVFIIIHFTDIILPTAIAGLCYVAVAAIRAVMAWKHSSIELSDTHIRINRGNIATIREYIRYRDIQSAGIASTPLTRYTRRVTLRISTNAGTVAIPSLRRPAALALLNRLLTPQVIGSITQ